MWFISQVLITSLAVISTCWTEFSENDLYIYKILSHNFWSRMISNLRSYYKYDRNTKYL